MLENIINEMVLGNFSFAILVIGIIQVFCMIRRNKVGTEKEKAEVVEDDFRGIEIIFDDGGSDTWTINSRKQFAIRKGELVIFDENGKFVTWYNLDKVKCVVTLDSEDIKDMEEE